MNTPTSLRLDEQSNRWCIGEHELHCGDCFKLYPDTAGLPPIVVRIEHSSQGWYLLTPYGPTQLSYRKAERL
jgi:hypothetical protein